MSQTVLANITLQPENNARLANLCGQCNQNLHHVAERLNVVIHHRGHHFQISGAAKNVDTAKSVLNRLYAETADNAFLPLSKVHLVLQQTSQDIPMQANESLHEEMVFQTKAGPIKPYTNGQRRYMQNILQYDINFCVGPAGTGKTYLAVASAVDALKRQQVQRIILVRPAVEAGEKLGFLPGSLAEKVDPYLRPLYDALFEMLGFEQVTKYLEQSVIEIAPLAYMRGRTLNESFIILDESQNTTREQMKMFLTRLGFGSKAIITGDITQTDLPKGKKSGLVEAAEILKGVEGICFTHFDVKDVVRHNLVQRIVEAYNEYEKKQQKQDEHQGRTAES